MKREYKRIFKSVTFQNIDLIKPRYFGMCCNCNEACISHLEKNEIGLEWICSHCDEKLDVKKLKKRKTLFDIQKQIIEYREQKQNTLGIFK